MRASVILKIELERVCLVTENPSSQATAAELPSAEAVTQKLADPATGLSSKLEANNLPPATVRALP